MRIWTATTHSKPVHDPAAEGADALDPAVRRLAAVTERGAEETPDRVAAEAAASAASSTWPNEWAATVRNAPCWFVIFPPWPMSEVEREQRR